MEVDRVDHCIFMSRFPPNKVPKRITPPFHICLLYEGEYEDPYSQFVRCFDEEVLSRFPSFLHWLIVWWYNRTHVQNIIPLLEGSRVDVDIKTMQKRELVRLLGDEYKVHIFDYYTDRSIRERLKSFPSKSQVILLPMFTATKSHHYRQQEELYNELTTHQCQILKLKPLAIENPEFLETFAECIRAHLITSQLRLTHLVFVAPRQDVSWFAAHSDYRNAYEHQSRLISQQIHKKMTYQVMIIGDKKNPILPQNEDYLFVPLAWWCGSKEFNNYCESTSKASILPHIGLSNRLLHHIITTINENIAQFNKQFEQSIDQSSGQ